MVKLRCLVSPNACISLGLLLQLMSIVIYLKYRSAIRDWKKEVIHNLQERTQTWNSYGVIMDFASTIDDLNELKRDTFDITLVTQCSVNNLHYLIETLHRWTGSISIALFTPGEYFIHGKLGLNSVTHCYPNRDIKFHLVYPLNKPPVIAEKVLEEWSSFYSMSNISARCNRLLDALRTIAGNNYALGDIAYPQNTLRNVAKKGVRSTHMFLLDIDVMPSYNVRESFLQHVLRASASTDDIIGPKHQVVYVTPVFEIEAEAAMPVTKQEILQAIKTEKARVFHAKTCPVCHKPTNYNDWLSIPEDPHHPIAFEAEWSHSWEPFYISSTSVPDYDERFKQYGYDRISQVCELYVAGYNFFVLSNLFVIHRGLKTPGKFHDKKDAENKKNLKIFNNEFKNDLKKKYPKSKRSCTELYKREGRAEIHFHPRIQK